MQRLVGILCIGFDTTFKKGDMLDTVIYGWSNRVLDWNMLIGIPRDQAALVTFFFYFPFDVIQMYDSGIHDFAN